MFLLQKSPSLRIVVLLGPKGVKDGLLSISIYRNSPFISVSLRISLPFIFSYYFLVSLPQTDQWPLVFTGY
jgi:hypothetical protein